MLSFNAAKESSKASSGILCVLYWSGHYTIKKGSSETTLSYISWGWQQSGIK